MADTEAGPPAKIEAHDPLPESSWLWRRVFSFVLTVTFLVALYALGYATYSLAHGHEEQVINRLYAEFRFTVLLTFIIATYYMAAPSAEQIVRMWQTAALFK